MLDTSHPAVSRVMPLLQTNLSVLETRPIPVKSNLGETDVNTDTARKLGLSEFGRAPATADADELRWTLMSFDGRD